MQQMVEIAKALSYNARVLIMDEPTAALTDTEIADLFALIRQLRAQGTGIVHISHRLEELQQIADRVTVMRDGQYIDTLPIAAPAAEVCAGRRPLQGVGCGGLCPPHLPRTVNEKAAQRNHA